MPRGTHAKPSTGDQLGGGLGEIQIALDLFQFSCAPEAIQNVVSALNVLVKFSSCPCRYMVVSSANSLSKSDCSVKGREIPLRPLCGSVRKQCIASANMRKRYGARGQPCRTDLDRGILSPFVPDRRIRLWANEYVTPVPLIHASGKPILAIVPCKKVQSTLS